MDLVDLVVVGGGIAGAAIASRMTAAGATVVVLEQTDRFVDRVRGEFIAPWGVREAIDLGLWDMILSVEHNNLISRIAPFEDTLPEDVAMASMRDVTTLLPGVPGAVGISHPGLCEALLSHAASCGATVHRGTASTHVTGGAKPTVRWELGGHTFELSARVVVASDGRGSAIRRQFGLALHETEATRFLAGMLVADTDGWPRDVGWIGIEGDREFIVFPQADGLTRVYVGWSIDQPSRFGGANRQQRFLAATRANCASWAAALADGTPAGPCSWFPMTDSWLDDPVQDGVVFAGDAAGWSNPLIGQGLSVAMRDAHVLTDTLLANEHWTHDTLQPYGDERRERMRRLRLSLAVNQLSYGFGPEAAERRVRIRSITRAHPRLGLVRRTNMIGPWELPADVFSDETYETLATC
ncbi:MAG TPA: NAD(P)/FAD-dependent oxidoreductase [Ilumatobacteraceae bacterium]|nr:NAD(P)/FAD-dependent oxidoreductase [Ilumatobacteraceae bacterium]